MAKPKNAKSSPTARGYEHPSSDLAARPEVGTESEFPKAKRKPPAKYKFDSSLSPRLEWDEGNAARERGEALIRTIDDENRRVGALAAKIAAAKNADEARKAADEMRAHVAAAAAATEELRALSKPFLNWTGKGERLTFDVPTLPIFVHERLSTKAIIETLKGHKSQLDLDLGGLFKDPKRSIVDQTLRAYEYRDDWVNRMILGDSLVVMNSLLQYEGLGGQVQMIYMDPPYGVSFGSNFQPFVRKRDVSHNDDEDMTREPEMVQAYRDTWELGVHSYLTYLRDRLTLCRELLTPSGSIFVQISDENVHHVREVMDEVFGGENAVAQIVVQKTGGLGTSSIKAVADYLLWYAKDRTTLKYQPLFRQKIAGVGESTGERYDRIELPDGVRRGMTLEERDDPSLVPRGTRFYQLDNLTSGAFRENTTVPYVFEGETFHPGANACWKTTTDGLDRLVQQRRIEKAGRTIRYVRFLDDFPAYEVTNVWDDVAGAADKLYVVQTSRSVIARCILMTTNPGDLVFDPTCGSGTTASAAEHWGRRWITADVSRVPLALARQRLLTSLYPWFKLRDEKRGPASGFIYERRQNARGEEVGGIIPHVTLGSIANAEAPEEEILVDRPETLPGITRVTGPFTFEATIPAPMNWDPSNDTTAPPTDADPTDRTTYVDRMIEILRRSPILRLAGKKTVTLKNVRPPARTLSLSAEAVMTNGEDRPVAIVFGPENGAVSEALVFDAAKEARIKNYTHLFVIGFAIEPNARAYVDKSDQMGINVTYVQATPDLLMGDLLRNMRSSQIFSVSGLPEIKVERVKAKSKADEGKYQVTLLGFDVFDPIDASVDHRKGDDVPAWFLDTDYNGLCFHVCQAFFPRTAAWDNIKKALKTDYDASVWEHLAGTTSAAFELGPKKTVAVKVIDDRGNELVVVERVK